MFELLPWLDSLGAKPGVGLVIRSALAAVTAFGITMLVLPVFLRSLNRRGVGERNNKGDSAHLDRLHCGKKGTPTMGGAVVVLAILASTLAWGRVRCPWFLPVLAVGILLALVGWVDDYLKWAGRRRGLGARAKLAGQIVIGLGGGWAIYCLMGQGLGEEGSSLFIPLGRKLFLWVGPVSVLLSALVITASSNAVNLTDGLDGLATGCMAITALALAAMAYIGGHPDLSHFFGVPHVSGGGELSVVASAMVGGGLAFLWFNCHPAEVFMGDTGALALGGLLGAIAIAVKQEILLIAIGGVFVAETLSVILQVGSFKLRGKRIFRIAPLHHHFEFIGWPEAKVTTRFWLCGAAMAVLAILFLRLR